MYWNILLLAVLAILIIVCIRSVKNIMRPIDEDLEYYSKWR